jgi:O-antigen/teichoic acid export membrane protein
LAKGIFSTIRFKIDNILIAKFFSAPTLGVYVVAKDLATIPAGQIIQPIMQPIYVGLAEHLNAPAKFADKVHKIILSIGMIVIPITVGTDAVSTNLVHVLLGDEWLQAIPILNVITYILLSGALNNFFSTILMVLGKDKASFALDAVFGITSIGVFVWLISNLSIIEFAWLRVLLGYSIALFTLFYIKLVSAVSLMRIFALLLFPILLSLGMYGVIISFDSLVQIDNKLLELLIHIFIGSFVYIVELVIFTFILKSKIAEFSFLWQTFFLSLFQKVTKERVKKVGI